jgi:excisionase family DNA binding protein
MHRRSFLTTFEISELCEVNPTTVQNWVKEGKLKAYATPGGHRRIRREDLVRFMRDFGMPIPGVLEEPVPYILVVDDEKDVLDLLTEVMLSGEEDLEVAGAQSGVDALLMIGERKPDLLILDIRLPGMNGIEVCQKLKAGAATGNLKIVAITGDHDPAVRERVLASGADLFFAKPFDMMQFRNECIQLMNSPRVR